MDRQADDSPPGGTPGGGLPGLLAGFEHGGAWAAAAPSAALAAALEAAAGPEERYDGAGTDALVGIVRQWAAVESWAAAGLHAALRTMMREDRDGRPLLRRRQDLPDGWDDSLNYEIAGALAMGAPSPPAPGPPTSQISSTPSPTTRAGQPTPATPAPAAEDATRSNSCPAGGSLSRNRAGTPGPPPPAASMCRNPGGTSPEGQWPAAASRQNWVIRSTSAGARPAGRWRSGGRTRSSRRCRRRSTARPGSSPRSPGGRRSGPDARCRPRAARPPPGERPLGDASDLLWPERVFTPPDDTLRKVIDPLKQAVRGGTCARCLRARCSPVTR
jgi:hypothetical protein